MLGQYVLGQFLEDSSGTHHTLWLARSVRLALRHTERGTQGGINKKWPSSILTPGGHGPCVHSSETPRTPKTEDRLPAQPGKMKLQK
jgi:hypothetical protein